MRISDWSSDVCSSDLTLRVVRMNKGAPTRASRALIVWLIAEGETPRSAAAAEKLRLSATRRKASIPSSAPWGIVKSCFKALADYRGLSICATAHKDRKRVA